MTMKNFSIVQISWFYQILILFLVIICKSNCLNNTEVLECIGDCKKELVHLETSPVWDIYSIFETVAYVLFGLLCAAFIISICRRICCRNQRTRVQQRNNHNDTILIVNTRPICEPTDIPPSYNEIFGASAPPIPPVPVYELNRTHTYYSETSMASERSSNPTNPAFPITHHV